jgi:hypothetical protein
VAAIVWADVEALQSNLSSVSAAAQMIILAHVNEDLNPRMFGGDGSAKYHLARCFLAAHLGELERRKGGQAMSSKTIGTSSITIAYARAMTTGEALLQTSWGTEYDRMVRSSPLRIMGGRTS